MQVPSYFQLRPLCCLTLLVAVGCAHSEEPLLRAYEPVRASSGDSGNVDFSSQRPTASADNTASYDEPAKVEPFLPNRDEHVEPTAQFAGNPTPITPTASPEPLSDEEFDRAFDEEFGEDEVAEDSQEAFAQENVATMPGDSQAMVEPHSPEPITDEPTNEKTAADAWASLEVQLKGRHGRCRVSVCGKPMGVAPFQSREVPAGRHWVAVKCGGRNYAQWIEFQAGRPETLVLKPSDFKRGAAARTHRRGKRARRAGRLATR